MLTKEQLKEIVDYIDPGCTSYQEWLSIGMAMQYEGFTWQEWDLWSSRDSHRYKFGDCEKRWNGFSESKGTIVTGGTIVEIAKSQGYHFTSDSKGEALDWDSEINDDLRFIDSAWIEGIELQEPGERWSEKQDLITYLSELFEPDEHVGFVVHSNDGKPADAGTFSMTAGELIDELKKYDSIGWATGDYDKSAGAWIRFNPLDGKGVKNDNVTAFRYALVESDNMDLDKQLALIHELELPCKAIVYSGSKSIHAIVKVDAKSYAEYQKKVEYLYRVCEANGFDLDKANKNPSRLSRMPGVYRGEHKQFLISTNTGKESFEEWKDWIEDVNDDMGDIESLPEEDVRPELAPELIRGILRNGHKMLVSGPSKAGKSFLLLQLGLAIAQGTKWLGRECRKGNVLYVNLELDSRSCVARIYDILETQDKSFHDVRDTFKIWNLRGRAVPMDKLAKKLIRRTEKYHMDAVIIDPIYKVLTGDENNAKDMADFTNQFDKIAREMGCAVIYCHHHSKGYQGQKRAMDRASGSGVFARDPDAILDLSELEVAPSSRDEYAMAPTDTAWRIDATLREFPSPEPIDLYFRYPIHELDEIGALKDLQVESEKPPWQRGQEKMANRREKKAEKQREQFEVAFASYTSFNEKVSMPVIEIATQLGIGEQAMRNRISKYDGYFYKNGEVFKSKK